MAILLKVCLKPPMRRWKENMIFKPGVITWIRWPPELLKFWEFRKKKYGLPEGIGKLFRLAAFCVTGHLESWVLQ